MRNLISNFWHEPWGLSAAAGILLGFSFPPFNLPVLQIPAFILLFRLSDISFTWREVTTKVYFSFLIWNLITTYWLMMATFAGGMAAIFANSLLMLIPLLIIRQLLRTNFHPLPVALLIGAIWTSYEFLHHQWDLAWPWLALGNGWANMPDVIQYISFTGHLGISFWIITSSAMIYFAINSLKKNHFYHAIILFLIFPAFSILSKIIYQETAVTSIEVAVIQPDTDSYERYGGLENANQLLTSLLELSDSVRTNQTALIVWPENAIDSVIPQESFVNQRIRDSLSVWNTELITGSGFVEYYEESSEPPLIRKDDRERSYNIYNAALHFSNSRLPDVYKKRKLVPIIERVPYTETLRKLDLPGLINWSEIAGYGRGAGADNFFIGNHKTPALVCYDSVFPSLAGEFVRNGADFITIITNDGWWGNTTGHIQHFAYARIRAIEFRRWIARSANNGISGIISPDGKVQLQTDYGTRTAFTFRIYPSEIKTFFAIYGNWFNWLMILGSVISIFLIIRVQKLQ